jgi:microcin C transport system substrate-binding protein
MAVGVTVNPHLFRAAGVTTLATRAGDKPYAGSALCITTYAWGETRLPGSELRDYWGSEAAAQSGSGNVIGIQNPAVDALIGHVLLAKHYDDLVAAVRALDRVLLWNHYVVPQWSYNKLRVARWDRFSHPDPLPKYGISGFPSLWWWDADKAARVRDRR